MRDGVGSLSSPRSYPLPSFAFFFFDLNSKQEDRGTACLWCLPRMGVGDEQWQVLYFTLSLPSLSFSLSLLLFTHSSSSPLPPLPPLPFGTLTVDQSLHSLHSTTLSQHDTPDPPTPFTLPFHNLSSPFYLLCHFVPLYLCTCPCTNTLAVSFPLTLHLPQS